MEEKLSPCACMGPMYGEPHCLCKMQQRGLKLNEEARSAEHARAKAQRAKFMESGGFSADMPHSAGHEATPVRAGASMNQLDGN